MGVEAPVWQGVKMQEYSLYFKFSQRDPQGCGKCRFRQEHEPARQAGWIGGQKCECILQRALRVWFVIGEQHNPLLIKRHQTG